MSTTEIREICDFVKKQIMSGNYNEGDRVSERTICELFGVSRTIVREALFDLKKEGWIYAESKSGTYVAPLDENMILANYEARMALEPTILLMSYPNLTDTDLQEMKENCDRMENAATKAEYSIAENDQHKILHKNVHNVYIRNFMESMMDAMTRIGSKCGKTKQRQRECTEEWRGIIRSLEARNPHEASQKFMRHIQNSYDAYIKFNGIQDETPYHVSGEAEWL